MNPEGRHILKKSAGARAVRRGGTVWCVVIPFGYLALPLLGHDVPQSLFLTTYTVGVLIFAVALLRLRRKTLSNHPFTGCRGCEYDLTGLSPRSPVCPECGVAAGSPSDNRSSDHAWHRYIYPGLGLCACLLAASLAAPLDNRLVRSAIVLSVFVVTLILTFIIVKIALDQGTQSHSDHSEKA